MQCINFIFYKLGGNKLGKGEGKKLGKAEEFKFRKQAGKPIQTIKLTKTSW